MKKMNFIIIGQQPWDTEIGSNCKDIALELSKHHQVLYVNSPLDRATLVQHRKDQSTKVRLEVVKGERDGLIQIQDNLWNYYPDCIVESINWLRVDFVFDVINKINNKKFYHSILKAISRLGFKDYVLFNDNEIIKCFFINELLQPELSVYYSRDYILATPYWKKHGVRLEPLMIAKYDLCLANSEYLTDYCRQYNSNAFFVGQGCDLKAFQTETRPERPLEYHNINGPVIGYVGALQSIRLDVALIEYIAESRPEWTIVLVGPQDEKFQASKLHQLKNVLFTGLKPQKDLFKYINSFDVCINPQLVNELTIGNYPRKIDEYLAAGKPVVATKTRAMDLFKDYTYLAERKEDYLELIKLALIQDTEELARERKAFAESHTWENSVKSIYEQIARSLKERAQ
eukprot:gene19571-23447_t